MTLTLRSLLTGRRAWLSITAVASLTLLIGVTLGASAFGLKQRDPDRLRDLESHERGTRDGAVESILQDRSELIKRLIPLIDPANAGKYPELTRRAAAFLLGEFRGVEAIPVLAKALADPELERTSSDGSPYDFWTVFAALIRIGRPAIPAMIENIETSDNELLRQKSMLVVGGILGGKRRLLELLTKLEQRALKKQSANREALRRIREGRAWVEVKVTESQEPLY